MNKNYQDFTNSIFKEISATLGLLKKQELGIPFKLSDDFVAQSKELLMACFPNDKTSVDWALLKECCQSSMFNNLDFDVEFGDYQMVLEAFFL